MRHQQSLFPKLLISIDFSVRRRVGQWKIKLTMLWSVWFAGNAWHLVQGSCHVVFRDTKPGDSAARTHKGHSHFRVFFDCGESYFSSSIFHFTNSWCMMWHDPHLENFLVIVAFKFIQTLRNSTFKKNQ